MVDGKGLAQIPITLTAEQAAIVAEHARLKSALASIEYPKSGRWEDRETVIELLEALATYLSAFFDKEIDDDTTEASSHSELLQDLITHFRQGKWGTMDRRLAPNKEGAAGAAHDDTMNELKRTALEFVDIVARREKAVGTKDPVAEARRKVARAYLELGLTIPTTRGTAPQAVTATRLESWDKRPPEERRARST